MDFFLRYKLIILRSFGLFMLLTGFIIHFWITPQMVAVSKNDIAAANVARMQASVLGDSVSVKKKKRDISHLSKSLASAQQKQLRYLTVFVMIVGGLFLGYSLLKKEED